MTIKEAFFRFQNYFNFVQPESLYELETLDLSFIDEKLHGKTNQIHEDSLGQVINIGDLVAYDKIGGTCKGISKGIVLGYTETGYRVARIHRDPRATHFHCSEIQTPYRGAVIVIKKNRK